MMEGPPFDGLSAVDPQARAAFGRLLGQPLVGEEGLERNVVQYLDVVHHLAQTRPFIGVAQAEALARTSQALLRSVAPDTPDRDRRLIQAAVRYFLTADDAVDDLSSQDGFDDDVQVMNVVVQALGRPDLVVPLSAD